MEPIQDLMKKAMSDASLTARQSFDGGLPASLSALEHALRRVDAYNRTAGSLNESDGYDCKACMNRGDFAEVETTPNGMFYERNRHCECMTIRDSILRMRRSGLAESIKRCTFELFEASTDWQKAAKELAMQYTEDADRSKWFFIGGAIGSGKTHLCTAIARHFLYSVPVKYMLWTTESAKLKAIINDDGEYDRLLRELKTVEVLYIDDFFKPSGSQGQPTAADVRLAYDILNYRYANRLRSIISSERYLSELMDIDEAIASRIAERTHGYCLTVKRDRAKNYRLTMNGTVL